MGGTKVKTFSLPYYLFSFPFNESLISLNNRTSSLGLGSGAGAAGFCALYTFANCQH